MIVIIHPIAKAKDMLHNLLYMGPLLYSLHTHHAQLNKKPHLRLLDQVLVLLQHNSTHHFSSKLNQTLNRSWF